MTRLAIRLALLLACALAAFAPPSAGRLYAQEAQQSESAGPAALVRLKSKALVDSDLVRLGDLFEGLGEIGATAVARAPMPGKRVTLDARWLHRLAQAYALPWRPGPALGSIVVERASQVIERDGIENLLRQGLAERGLDGDLRITFDAAEPRLHLPTDATPSLRLAALSLDPASGRFTARLASPAEGEPLVRAVVTGRAQRMIEVPVPARRVGAGEVITTADLDWARLPANRVARNVVTDPAQLVGMSPRRALRDGQPVRAGDLRLPVVVAKNHLVTIRLDMPKMVLTVQGRALQDGARGEVIRVMNTHSNKIVNAAVAGPGVVTVEPSLTP